MKEGQKQTGQEGRDPRMHALRKQFVMGELPEFEAQNRSFHLGYRRLDLIHILWRKSRRLIAMQSSSQEPVSTGEETTTEKAS